MKTVMTAAVCAALGLVLLPQSGSGQAPNSVSVPGPTVRMIEESLLPGCGPMDTCCPEFYCGGSGLFAEFMYLRPRDAEVAFAVPIDGPIVDPTAPPVQIGATALVDPEFSPGFRAGYRHLLPGGGSVVAQYSLYESHTTNQASIAAPDVMFPLVIHPTTFNAATTALQASAQYAIDYDLIDINYEAPLVCGEQFDIGYLVGVRLGRMEQSFRSQFDFNGTTNVATDVNFDGAGINLGLDAQRHWGCRGFAIYGRGLTSFVAGEFGAQYVQTDAFAPTVADITWNAGRIVTILEMELGVTWASCDERLQFRAGYLFSSWINAVKVEDFIKAVQANQLDDPGDDMTFDGLIVRAEYRF